MCAYHCARLWYIIQHKVLTSITEVTLHQVRLVPGWATVLGQVKGYGIKADREDSGYTTLESGLAANTFS